MRVLPAAAATAFALALLGAQPGFATHLEPKSETAPAASAESGATKADTETEPASAAKPETTTQETETAPAPSADDAEKAESESLTVASWGGAYGKSQELAFIKPFQNETGIAVNLVSHGGRFDALKPGGDSQPPQWDVVDMGAGKLDSACRDGLLEKIDAADIGVNGTDDFLPGALHKCGVATVAWSSAIVFDRRAYEKDMPASAADFFNIEEFPGKRALPKNPKYVLPLALMADGVAPNAVYQELAGPTGIDHALAMLDKIRAHTMWWEQGHEPLKWLSEKKVAQAIAFNGRVFYAIVRDNQPFGIIWDGQIYDLDMWAVPKGSPNKAAALRFIAFSTQPERLAAQTRWFPYGPMRKSAITRIGKHAQANIEMRDYVPTAAANFKRALQLDEAWWAENAGRLTRRFEAWLAKPVEQDDEEPEADAADSQPDKEN